MIFYSPRDEPYETSDFYLIRGSEIAPWSEIYWELDSDYEKGAIAMVDDGCFWYYLVSWVSFAQTSSGFCLVPPKGVLYQG